MSDSVNANDSDIRVTCRRAVDGGYSVDVTRGEILLFARALNLRPGETMTLHLLSLGDLLTPLDPLE